MLTLYIVSNDGVALAKSTGKFAIFALAEKFKNEERVIILGDFNCKDFSFFSKFTDAGFGLANNDATLPTLKGWNVALDNIIYKGVGVSGFSLLGTDLSDHYTISCLVTVY